MRAKQLKRGGEKGSALIEISLSYATLVIVALLTLKASVNASSSQSWTVKQAMTDAFITKETALASRIPFSDITGPSSLWGIQPAVTTSTVTVGKLPGGQQVTATLHRTRIADTNNLPAAGGTGTVTISLTGFNSLVLLRLLNSCSPI